MNLVSIDIETTGLDAETCQIIEFGAILNGPWDTDLCPRFHCYVIHDVIKGEPFALAMHAKILQRIADRDNRYRYLRTYNLIPTFRKWLVNNDCSGEIAIAGKNFANFDLPFLRKIAFWHTIKMNHRILDPSMLYWQPAVDGFELPDTATCARRAGINLKITHTALHDAEFVLELIRRAAAKL
jgi:DNA polymerase III epsilon subunit-like protein